MRCLGLRVPLRLKTREGVGDRQLVGTMFEGSSGLR